MTKYIIRGSIAAVFIVLNTLFLIFNGLGLLSILFNGAAIGISLMEFIICLICYHHALWTNQDQTEQKSQDGTK